MNDTKHKQHPLDFACWFPTCNSTRLKFSDALCSHGANWLVTLVASLAVLSSVSVGLARQIPTDEAKQETSATQISSEAKDSSDAINQTKLANPVNDTPKEIEPKIAIINATIHTMAGSVINKGRIVVKGTLIEAIGGEELPLAEDIRTIDANGLNITPGWIDVNSQLWMSDSPSDAGSSDGSLLATDSLDSFAEDWADVLDSGVTTVYVQPSSLGAMSGLGAAVSVAPQSPGSLRVLNPAAGLQMSLGNSQSNRDRATRFESIKKTLQSVVDYKKKWDDYEKAMKEEAAKSDESTKSTDSQTATDPSQRAPSEGSGRGRRGRETPGEEKRPSSQPLPNTGEVKPGAGSNSPTIPSSQSATKDTAATPADAQAKEAPKKPVKPEKDLVKDRLLGVISGKIPARLEVRNANDVRYAAELKKAFPDVQWIWEGLDQLGSSLEEVKKSRATVVVGPFLNLAIPSRDSDNRRTQLASFLNGYQGVVVVQSKSNSKNGSRLLREQLAAAKNAGLNTDSLLRSVTSEAARIIGCEKQIGMLAPGYSADLVGFTGDPLDTTSSIALVMVHGELHKNRLSESNTASMAERDSNPVISAKSFSKLPEKGLFKAARLLLPEGIVANEWIMDSGKIVKIQSPASSSEKPSTELVDLGNAFVTPGLLSVYSTFGIDATARGTDSDSSNLSASDLSLSDQRSRHRLEESGLFHVALTTSSTNTLAGQLSLFSTDLDQKKVTGQISSKIVLSSDARSVDRFPSSLAGQVKLVRDTLDGKRSPSRLFIPEATLVAMEQAKTAAISRLLDRSQLALFHVNDDAEIEAAIRIVRDFKLRAAFFGATAWSTHASEMKELGVSIISLPVKEADYPIYVDDLVRCHKEGVDVYFGGDTGTQIRATAGMAVRQGMDAKWARFAITYGHTKLFPGCEGKFVFQEGESADFLIWSDDPLNLSSKLLARVRNGKVIVNEENL